jgi:hypothetical protein
MESELETRVTEGLRDFVERRRWLVVVVELICGGKKRAEVEVELVDKSGLIRICLEVGTTTIVNSFREDMMMICRSSGMEGYENSNY